MKPWPDQRADHQQQQPEGARGERARGIPCRAGAAAQRRYVSARNTSSRPPSANAGARAELVERALSDHPAAAEQDETVADAAGVGELVDREKERAAARRDGAQQRHRPRASAGSRGRRTARRAAGAAAA